MRRLFLLIILTSFFLACKKDNENREQTTFRSKGYTDDLYYAGSNTHKYTHTTITYDEQGRMTMVQDDASPSRKTINTYPSENIMVYKHYDGTYLAQHEVYFINAQKEIDSAVGIYLGNEYDTVQFMKYVYDNSNRLVKVLRSYKSDVDGQILPDSPYLYEYDSKGNATKQSYPGTTYENTYYLDQPNLTPVPSLFGTPSPNLLKTQSLHLLDTTLNYRHTYLFDNVGRLVNDTTWLETMDGYGVRTYLY